MAWFASATVFVALFLRNVLLGAKQIGQANVVVLYRRRVLHGETAILDRLLGLFFRVQQLAPIALQFAATRRIAGVRRPGLSPGTSRVWRAVLYSPISRAVFTSKR